MANENAKQIVRMDVVRTGEKLIVPESISYKQAADELLRREKYEEEKTRITETINGFFFDAAIAFHKAMEETFGFVFAEAQRSFFREDPPQLINVPVDVNKTYGVPWGKFSVPGVEEGEFYTGIEHTPKGMQFQFSAVVKRKYETLVKRLAEKARQILREDPIYQGKAFQIVLRDEDGDFLGIPELKFMDLSDVDPNQLIFSDEVNTQIETNLFTPIRNTKLVREAGIPIKRGVLLAGKYGTGKTLAARVTAYHAVKHGWTFIYISSPNELPDALMLARQYGPAVIFSEDIDRAASLERTDEVNEILNTLDGIDGKDSEVMVILTTNHIENINQAMFRPGRLDAVINVTPPDAAAVQRLIRLYAGDYMKPNEDLEEVGKSLAGNIPAVIRECVERSKLYAIMEASKKNDFRERPFITAFALLASAHGMQEQLALLSPAVKPALTTSEQVGESIRAIVTEALEKQAEQEEVD